VRLLAEIPWLPTSFLDSRYVRWVAVDDHRASAKPFDAGDGKPFMTPFVGRFTE
jgi:hypothetical protein